ncbi:TraY domain-containing protein [Klebsiella pneumoniae]|uniref:TraY domain-containing protein n=1 Tax=Klebsiella pneumoniae TaxID=573 RepID=UPI0013906464|nr:TraY domain-containing protein [Klebsiella pneumoniae]
MRSNARPAPGKCALKLDEETNRRLIKAKDRSRRSKTAEAYLRLKDHLERFPDFYNSELAVR